jgi:hypothetical protein
LSIYELGILGAAQPQERLILVKTIEIMVQDFGLAIGNEVILHDANTVNGRDKRAAFAAAYFGGVDHLDQVAARSAMAASAPVIPTVAQGANFAKEIPAFLQEANGLFRRSNDPEMLELATAMLECVGLLRRQRRVFVSYRRSESRSAALQMHDSLNARGFDVFLDTHSIRPGDPFQDVLWHRMCDSDVMVMLDTPTYFDSRWTRQEFGRARAKDIHILRIVWPEHRPNKLTDMAETIYLERAELEGNDGPIIATTLDAIVLAVEKLRSRSIAARYMSITGRLRADVEKIGATIEGIGAHRAVAIRLSNDQIIWAYPVVGVPTAEILNEIVEKAQRAAQSEIPVLVYDHIGIRDSWNAHLRWLDANIHSIRSLKVAEAGWSLATWEG